MTLSDILSCPTTGAHNSRREGVRLGLINATTIWLWIAAIDAATGRPFHTFTALGGIVAFTAVHFILNITYGIVVLSVVHSAERAPSVILALLFGMIIFEGAFAMLTNLIATVTLGNVAWVAILGGNLIGTAIAFALLAGTHPLAVYLRRAEEER